MDWSKAKNILIAALIAANIFLGFMYTQNMRADEELKARAAELTARYLESLGVSLDCALSAEEERLPVLFVEIEEGDGADDGPAKDGLRVVLIGAEGQKAVPVRTGLNRGQVISASSAARRLVPRFSDEELKDLRVEGAELVYLVDRSGLESARGQDTAVPAWAFTTNRGLYYIEALAN